MKPTCATCNFYQGDPPPGLKMPTGGTGYCHAKRADTTSPVRTNQANWCDRHTLRSGSAADKEAANEDVAGSTP